MNASLRRWPTPKRKRREQGDSFAMRSILVKLFGLLNAQDARLSRQKRQMAGLRFKVITMTTIGRLMLSGFVQNAIEQKLRFPKSPGLRYSARETGSQS